MPAPQNKTCGQTQAGRFATAMDYSGTAHGAFQGLADAGGGGKYFQPTGGVLQVLGSAATAIDSAARGEPMDVRFARVMLPFIGGLGGGLGLAAAGELLSPVGAAAGAFAGGVGGAKVGDYLADKYAAARRSSAPPVKGGC